MTEEIKSPSVEDVLSGRVNVNDMYQPDGIFDDAKTKKLNEQQATEIRNEKLRLAKAYHAFFSTDAGKTVLDDVLSKTLRAVTWSPNHQNPEQQGFMREGQNSIAAYIIDMINFAMNPEKPRKDGRTNGKETS